MKLESVTLSLVYGMCCKQGLLRLGAHQPASQQLPVIANVGQDE